MILSLRTKGTVQENDGTDSKSVVFSKADCRLVVSIQLRVAAIAKSMSLLFWGTDLESRPPATTLDW